jgi:hypothetical protein
MSSLLEKFENECSTDTLERLIQRKLDYSHFPYLGGTRNEPEFFRV